MPRPAYPPTRTDDVIDELYGEQIADPYRWLEDGDSDDVRRWTAAQNALTEGYLAGVDARSAIQRRLAALLAIDALGAPAPAGGRYFYSRRRGNENQPVLYVRDGVHGADRVLIDPNALNTEGTTALDWYFPSDDGRMLAYGLSEDGSEESMLHVMDVDSGSILADRIARTRAADLAWLPDAGGFYYTRYPRAGEVPPEEMQYHRTVYFHRIGEDPATDVRVFAPAAKEHWPGIGLSPDGRWLVVTVARTFDQTDVHLQDRSAGTPLMAVVRDRPFLYEAQVVRDRLYIRTNQDAPTYRLCLADATAPTPESWREIVPPRPNAVLDGFLVTRHSVALSYLERATSRLRLPGLEGGDPLELPLPALGRNYGSGWKRTSIPPASKSSRSAFPRRMARPLRCSWCTAAECRWMAPIPPI